MLLFFQLAAALLGVKSGYSCVCANSSAGKQRPRCNEGAACEDGVGKDLLSFPLFVGMTCKHGYWGIPLPTQQWVHIGSFSRVEMP